MEKKQQKKNVVWDEIRLMLNLSWPMTVTYGSAYLVQPMSIIFCSTLGKKGLDAASLGMTIIMMMVHPAAQGLSFTCNNFFAQFYGTSGQKKIGTFLQRGILISLIIYIVICIVVINSDTILMALGQDAEICILTRKFLVALIPGILGKLLFHILSKYLECMGKLMWVCVLNIVGVSIGGGFHYLLLNVLKMDIRGGGLALGLTYWTQVFLLTAFILINKTYKDSWEGFTRKSMMKWSQFNKDLMPAIFQTAIWCSAAEFCNILSGMVSQDLLAVQSILFQIDGIGWVIPMGVAFASITRIGYYLGKNDIEGIKRVKNICLGLELIFGALYACVVYAIRRQFAGLFTEETKIIDEVSRLIPFTVCYGMCNFMCLGCMGILRSARKYMFTIVMIFVTYYFIAMPLGIPLMFLTDWGLAGLLLACNIGAFLNVSASLVMIQFIDWVHIIAQTLALITDDVEAKVEEIENQFEVDEKTSLLSSSNQSSSDIPCSQICISKLPLFIILVVVVLAGFGIAIVIDVPTFVSDLAAGLNATNASDVAMVVTMGPVSLVTSI